MRRYFRLASNCTKGCADIYVASSSSVGCFMAFHGTPKIHADLPPGVRQGGVEGVGFSASGEAGGLHVFLALSQWPGMHRKAIQKSSTARP